jgi:hypothetical protein
MSLFQCEVCGSIEKTHLSSQGFYIAQHNYDWAYAPERKGMRLCSACGPTHLSNGELRNTAGKWHNKFPRYILPPNSCYTNDEGDVIHKETGLTASQFIIKYPNQITKLT